MTSATASKSGASDAACVEIVPLNGFVGAEIRGIDLRRPLDDEQFRAVHDAFVKYEVIVLRDQAIALDDQIAFATRFGNLSIHPFAPKKAGRRDVIEFDHNEANPPDLTDCWHSDETYRECPAMATLLRCQIAPASGGDTLFASMSAAYRGLSARMQSYIHGLEAQHDFTPWRHLFNTPELRHKLRKMEDDLPNPWHPVVRVHPVTGRRSIYVNSQFTLRIRDLEEPEAKTILNFLCGQAQRPEYQLRVKWAPNTVVMWDNRSVQHYASHDYYPQRRKMDRVTIEGDRPIGVSGEYTPETIPGIGFVKPLVTNSGAVKRDFELP